MRLAMYPDRSGAGLPSGTGARIVVGRPGCAARHRWELRLDKSTNKGLRVRTYSPKASEIQRAWHVIDAEGLVLGRLATEVARILRGKHKPTFAPHIDTGDHVIIVNADKVVLTSDKADKKLVYRHSGYPGGIKSADLRRPAAHASPQRPSAGRSGACCPKTRLGRQMLKKLKVYAGPTIRTRPSSPSRSSSTQARARS